MRESDHPVADMVIRLYPRLVARLRGRMRIVENDAEDLIQDLYIRLRRVPRDASIARPVSFIMRAADNLAIDRTRQSGRAPAQESVDVVDSAPTVEREIDARRRLRILRDTVESLPERQRTAFVLSKYEHLTPDEISIRMGISRSGVEKLLAKALATCRQAVGDFK